MTVQSAAKGVTAAVAIFVVVAVLSDYYEFLTPMKKWLVLPVVAAGLNLWWLKRRQKWASKGRSV